MTVREASEIIGVSPAQVRYLCKVGKIKAIRRDSPTGGWYYTITQREAVRYRDSPRDLGGWPKGKPRKQRKK